MPLLVIMEYTPMCPRCPTAEKVLRAICNELRIPLLLRRIGSMGRVGKERYYYVPSSVQHTYTEDFAREQGDREAERAIRELKRIGIDPSRLTPTPVIRIVYTSRYGEREVVIRGFPLEEDEIRRVGYNLYSFLKILAEGLR